MKTNHYPDKKRYDGPVKLKKIINKCLTIVSQKRKRHFNEQGKSREKKILLRDAQARVLEDQNELDLLGREEW